MKILVDHGSGCNLGDTAMLEGAVLRIVDKFPKAEIFIIDRPGLMTKLWRLPNVHRQEIYRLKMVYLLENIPFIWRYDRYWQKIISLIFSLFLGNLLSSGPLSLSDKKKKKTKKITLGKFCEPFDALHIAGGGNLTDTFRALFLHKCCLIQTFIEQRKSVILTGQQIGPFNSLFLKKRLSKILKKINFVGLREPGYSFAFCKESNINKNHFDVMGDDSFGISSVDKFSISDFFQNGEFKPYKFLAVNVRVAFYTKEVGKSLQQIAILVKKIAIRLKMPVLIIPIALNSGDSDIESGKELIRLANYTDIKVLKHPNPTPALIKGILSKAFGAVGVSYHFCTFALSEGVPAICINDGAYYSQKARGLCLFWEDERLALSLKQINIDSAVEHIVQVLKDASLRKKLYLHSKQASKHWQSVFDKQIKNILVEKIH